MYRDTRLFKVEITERPDSLDYNSFCKYDVIVSNWNTWPDNDARLTPGWEYGFSRYIKEGGGAVFVHAGASSFYKWDEYHRIGIGRWGKETSHGIPLKGKVFGFDKTNPITGGLRDFYIVDELWRKTEIHADAEPLASVSWVDEADGKSYTEQAVFTSQTGKGRSFYTILGHDERALLNTGLQTLLIRGTIWASGRAVTAGIPVSLKDDYDKEEISLSWHKSDSTISLENGRNIVWQFNFNNRFGKQYFHPVNAGSSTLTCVSPPDHPWHMGLWFSWKFINGVNYWEYLDEYKSEETGYISAGITSIRKMEFFPGNDLSAGINLDIVYRPREEEAVMSEKCRLYISPPQTDGSYYIDFDRTFSPAAGDVVLDRTPVLGEPEGQSWGGYSGLSVRFSQDYTSPVIIAPDTSNNRRKNNWVCMGFNTLTGENAGICFMQDPEYTTSVTSWYIINRPLIPFYYFSPAVIYDGKIIIKKGEELHLKYRAWIITGKISMEDVQLKYNDFIRQ